MIAGLAWDKTPVGKGVFDTDRKGVGMVAGVEVSIDGGQTWRQARWSHGLGPAQNQGLGPGLRPGHKRLWERVFPLWPMPMEEDPLLCPHTDAHTRMLYQVKSEMMVAFTVNIIILHM